MATITGTPGNDVLTGTSADDVIDGGTGDDTLTGGGGHNQFVFGLSFGQVTITDFHSSQDQLVFTGLGPGHEVEVTHGSVIGSDFAVHGVSYVSVQGLPGLITVQDSYLSGTDLSVSDGDSVSLFGIDFGGYGTGQTDVLFGGANPTTIWGWDGDDHLYAGDQPSTLLGGAGNDTLVGGASNDVLDGDFGGITPIAPGDDVLHGGGGDDQLISTGGSDVLDGGPGRDLATVSSDSHAIHLDLSLDGVAQDIGGGRTITLQSIEALNASSPFDDVLTAAGLTTSVSLQAGGGGHDTLIGGSGDDMLTTTSGSNTLTGGAGRDIFQIVTAALGSPDDPSLVNFDTITDFQSGVDTLDFGGPRITIINNPGGGGVVYADTSGDGVDDQKVVLSTGHVTENDFALLYGVTAIYVSTASDDLISGPQDNWAAYGGANVVSYAQAATGVRVSLALQGQAQDTIGAGHDTLISQTGLIGSSFDDVLTGNGAKNILTGGLGADVFTFKPDGVDPDYFWQIDHGADTITDFSHAQGDRLDVSAFGLTSLQQVLALAHQDGADAVLMLGQDTLDTTGRNPWNSVTLKGVQLFNLTAADFIFAPALAAYSGGGASELAFRNMATGDWGFMSAGPSGEVWHPVGPTSPAYGAIGVGDFNGDGVADIAFRQLATGAWGYMSANPGGGETWHDVGPTSTGYGAVGVGDFNGDGVLDIAFRSLSTGDWGFMSANPGGGQTWHSGGPTSLGYAVLGVGDFNLDGLPDIAFRSTATGDWGFMSADPAHGEVWRGVGSTSLQYAAIGVGDFNGDGTPDIAFRNPVTGDWGFMSAHPGGGQTWHPAGPTSTAYAAVASGDYNGDGLMDIAFRDPVSGDWGFMSVGPAGGEIWHPMGPSSTAYAPIA